MAGQFSRHELRVSAKFRSEQDLKWVQGALRWVNLFRSERNMPVMSLSQFVTLGAINYSNAVHEEMSRVMAANEAEAGKIKKSGNTLATAAAASEKGQSSEPVLSSSSESSERTEAS